MHVNYVTSSNPPQRKTYTFFLFLLIGSLYDFFKYSRRSTFWGQLMLKSWSTFAHMALVSCFSFLLDMLDFPRRCQICSTWRKPDKKSFFKDPVGFTMPLTGGFKGLKIGPTETTFRFPHNSALTSRQGADRLKLRARAPAACKLAASCQHHKNRRPPHFDGKLMLGPRGLKQALLIEARTYVHT